MVESDEDFAPQEFPHTDTDVIVNEHRDENDGYASDEVGGTLSRRASSIFSINTTPLAPPNATDIQKFTSDEHHFSMMRNLHMADYITMLNGFSGFYSI
ncbi:BJ4_G0003630.mRNA.1.CDS.1, partial [Saccharomyces cerevisiae]